MSETWVDAYTDEYEDIGDGAYDSEDGYDGDDAGEDLGEESRSDRRRRERQRQIMQARQRQLTQARQRRAPGHRSQPARRAGQAAPSRNTMTAIRSLDLETKEGQDSLRRRIDDSDRRARRANWVAVTSSVVDQAAATFADDLRDHPYIAAGARFAPLLLLAPQKDKGGVEGIVTDPRVVGGAAILGIVLFGAFRDRSAGVSKILIDHPTPLKSGSILSAMALDSKGTPLSTASAPVSWRSMSGDLSVDQSGAVTGKTGAEGTVIAQAGGHFEWIRVKLTAS